MKNKRLGYCCINLTVPSKFRSTTVTWCQKNPESYKSKLLEIYDHNMLELAKIIDWNISNNIWLYRISSDLHPLHDHDLGQIIFSCWLNNNPESLEFCKKTVQKYIGLGGRLVIHPSQYNSIGSEKETTRNNTIINLVYHGLLFDKLGIEQSHFGLINIHLSGGKNPLPRLHFYHDTLSKLPETVLRRLTFETEDTGFWGASNIFKYFPDYPIVFDTLHHKCNNHGLSAEEAFEICKKSWEKNANNKKQLIHHSEGKFSEFDRRHSDYVKYIPDFNCDLDIELEAKKKDLAVIQHLQK